MKEAAIPLPPPLLAGDLIYVTHVAGAVNLEQFQRGVERLRALGFRVLFDPTLGSDGRYLAGDDEARARDFRTACEHPEVRAIITARGGYGCMRILERIGDVRFPPDRWLIGYSDVTALHAWAGLQRRATIHGPMVCGIGAREDRLALDHLLATVSGEAAAFSDLDVVRSVDSDETVRGTLIGGNLSLVCSLLGTRYLPDVEGKILFIEEVGEPLYRIDRMLTELAIRTRDTCPAAIVCGQFTRCAHNQHASHIEELVRERLAQFDCPSATGLPVGHDERTYSLMMNVRYMFDGSSLRRLQTSESAAIDGLSELSTATVISAKRPHDDLRVAVPEDGTRELPAYARARPYTSPGATLSLISQALRTGVCSALQLEVSHGGEHLLSVGAGSTGVTPDVKPRTVDATTVFDVASLTKALSTAVIAWKLIEENVLNLSDTIPPSCGVSGATLEDLLRHSSGLPGYRRIYPELRRREASVSEVRAAFRDIEIEAEVGTSAYSDPGYIQLGLWLEHASGLTLDTLFETYVATPLNLKRTGFRGSCERRIAGAVSEFEASSISGAAAKTPPEKLAATEFCGWRGRTLQGIVHDEHAQLLGGVAGHAGLFSTANEVTTIANSLLGYGPAILAPETVERMWCRSARVGSFVRGWDTPSGPRSNAGSLMKVDGTVGHLGFTGTSVWIDRSRELVVTLLTNRVHPTRTHEAIRALRPAIHDAVMHDFGGWTAI